MDNVGEVFGVAMRLTAQVLKCLHMHVDVARGR